MNLRTEALIYSRQGICVIPVHGKKALSGWKHYRGRVTKPELVGLFKKHGPKVTGLAILTGKRSRHWVCRDFDKAEAYENWAAEYPELAKILPTVKTSRGYHVYFRCFGTIETRKLADGELRAEGSYTMLPPSLHPSGARYEWLRPLNACHYPFYLDETGLNKLWLAPNVTQEVLRGEGLGLNEGLSKGSEDGFEYEKLREIQFVNENERMTLERAVEIALPRTSSRNHQSLFTLQRCLETMKIQDKLGAAAFKRLQNAAVCEWLELNQFKNRDNSDDDYMNEFIQCGKNVKVPYGAGVLTLAWERASKAEPDEAAKLFSDEAKQRACLLCRELQALRRNESFFLSARDAARLLCVTPMTASRWLKRFEALKIIELTKRGSVSDKQASEFRYIREMPNATTPSQLLSERREALTP